MGSSPAPASGAGVGGACVRWTGVGRGRGDSGRGRGGARAGLVGGRVRASRGEQRGGGDRERGAAEHGPHSSLRRPLAVRTPGPKVRPSSGGGST